MQESLTVPPWYLYSTEATCFPWWGVVLDELVAEFSWHLSDLPLHFVLITMKGLLSVSGHLCIEYRRCVWKLEYFWSCHLTRNGVLNCSNVLLSFSNLAHWTSCCSNYYYCSISSLILSFNIIIIIIIKIYYFPGASLTKKIGRWGGKEKEGGKGCFCFLRLWNKKNQANSHKKINLYTLTE